MCGRGSSAGDDALSSFIRHSAGTKVSCKEYTVLGNARFLGRLG